VKTGDNVDVVAEHGKLVFKIPQSHGSEPAAAS
jgi:hypothetical protein